ncbi:MAG TPA: carboxypeptidase regulatory-like domain-containing protein, partial [Gemmataceae bacterium]|nr:carboxypeptidase regulatory-like domain-containing protein [Gemmataceae bacterium]
LAASVLAVGVALGFGDPKAVAPPAKELPGKPVAKNDEPRDDGLKGDQITFAGRVVDADAKPVAGAKVLLVNGFNSRDPRAVPTLEATADSEGRFRIALDRPRVGFSSPTLLASSDGFGLGFLDVTDKGVTDVELRLSGDLPVRGRIIDLQGKPVVGATVRVVDVAEDKAGDLSAWAKKAEETGVRLTLMTILDTLPRKIRGRSRPLPGVRLAITDERGRFTLTGIGRERLATLRVEGPGIATTDVTVLTQPGPSGQFKLDYGDSELRRHPFYRPPFDYVAAPSQQFEGRVTDKETGKPIADVRLLAWSGSATVEAKTDKDGRYRLDGLPPGRTWIDFYPPRGVPYHFSIGVGGKANSIEPARLDHALRRAPWVAGRVIDERTRRPVGGAWVRYYPDRDNPQAREFFGDGPVDVITETGPDGTFGLAGIPGKGWLNVGHDRRYVPATERPVQGESTDRDPPSLIPTTRPGRGVGGHALVVVDVDSTKPKDWLVTLDPGHNISAALTDPEGKPVTGVIALGLEHRWSQWSEPSVTETVRVSAFNPDRPRPLVFYQPDRKLGAFVQPKVGDAGPWEVKLRPLATVSGRLVLPDGKPHANAGLALYISDPSGRGWVNWPPGEQPVRITTDVDGRFQFRSIIGELDYDAAYRVSRGEVERSASFRFRAKPGETKDLGTITTIPRPK